ncbi:hypothetical protein AUC60_11425 [Pseudomonas caspiana]|uniref:Uncharacterized protein n=1 Tax=Pseudomonas caspiana TaxID=1451454 RepID=A0A1Y3P567_9PSED|nr:hypothetical protein AUC60_11425 [Pseudomonas caspiana]
MKQYHFASCDREQYPGNGIAKINPDLPEPGFKLSNNGHTHRPSELDGFYINPDQSPVLAR